eukprot:TRINITY_DN11932_c0_g1_i1.p1 TRINITY_DN11932_c0_g1~~TRINITY_DN11932_c0_g1_i1.p1  ORF type:complete len:511 (-),score=96.96 TRINITY_DN11932_c0_g1_i1:224-1756(-)
MSSMKFRLVLSISAIALASSKSSSSNGSVSGDSRFAGLDSPSGHSSAGDKSSLAASGQFMSSETSSSDINGKREDYSKSEQRKAFKDFIARFGKKYVTEEERLKRFGFFCSNYDRIQEENAKGHSYTLGITQFADLTVEEFANRFSLPKRSYELQQKDLWGDLPKLQPVGSARLTSLPSSVDWRRHGAVTGVQNQGECGACWSFAATGAIEGAWKIAGGNLMPLSQQQFVDCAGGKWGNEGCKGGAPEYAFRFAKYQGVCSLQSYAYEARSSGTCQDCNVVVPAGGVMGFTQVEANDEEALMEAVSKGPVAVSINGQALPFQLYTGGILSAQCSDQIDHGVLLVGYGTDDGKDYWLVKNSWGLEWGEDGYIRVERGSGGAGECGILTQSSYPVLNPAKVIPGTFYIDPGTAAVIALFVLTFGIIFCILKKNIYSCCCFCCRRRRDVPLLQPTPSITTHYAQNPWVQPRPDQALRSVQTQAPPQSRTLQISGTETSATGVRSGNSRASRLL